LDFIDTLAEFLFSLFMDSLLGERKRESLRVCILYEYISNQ
jgi:hypothetical protein